LVPFFYHVQFWSCREISWWGLEPGTAFHCYGLFCCNLLAEIDNFGAGTILLCLVSEQQMLSLLGIEPRTGFWSLFLLSILRSKQLWSWYHSCRA
jgi:hypothetical protein